MKLIHGKYADAKVFTDLVEDSALKQVKEIVDQPFAENCRVRSMPDIHTGTGCPVGTTMQIRDKVCPNLVGVDIACGMDVTCIGKVNPSFEKLDYIINTCIPSGTYIRDNKLTDKRVRDMVNYLFDLRCFEAIGNLEYLLCSIGTLGGGNHFIELDKDKNGNCYLIIHSGSRYLGTKVCKYYMKKAQQENNKIDRQTVICQMKADGREKEIQDTLKRMKENEVPKDLACCQGQLFDDYIHDMKICEEYARLNRTMMADIIISAMEWNVVNHFETLHNYIDTDNMILRKGAVSAQSDELLIIPMNMRDGSLICVGKGNSDWNCSAPHGAGRIMSRSQARKILSMDDFAKSMDNIYSTSVTQETIDEAPMVYKPVDSIIENTKETVKVVNHIYPIYNFKAHEVRRVFDTPHG